MEKFRPRPIRPRRTKAESGDPIERFNNLTQKVGIGVFLGAAALGATGLAVLAAAGVGLDRVGGTAYSDIKNRFNRTK